MSKFWGPPPNAITETQALKDFIYSSIATQNNISFRIRGALEETKEKEMVFIFDCAEAFFPNLAEKEPIFFINDSAKETKWFFYINTPWFNRNIELK